MQATEVAHHNFLHFKGDAFCPYRQANALRGRTSLTFAISYTLNLSCLRQLAFRTGEREINSWNGRVEKTFLIRGINRNVHGRCRPLGHRSLPHRLRWTVVQGHISAIFPYAYAKGQLSSSGMRTFYPKLPRAMIA